MSGNAAYQKRAKCYKGTDVLAIPQDWDLSTVGAEFTIQLGKMLDAARNTGVPKPYIGNRAVQWCRIDLDAIATVPLSSSDLQLFRLQRGDLLVCEGGEIGRAAIWNDPLPECYYQKALHRLRATEGYNSFLMLCFLQLWASSGYLSNYVTQTSIAHLPKDKFELVPLPVPPLSEQQTIAQALSDVNGLIHAQEKRVAKMVAIKEGAMQQLLIGKIRLPGFTDKWRSTTLGEVADVENGATPSTGVGAFWNGTIPWCTPTDITKRAGKHLSTTERNLTVAGLASCAASLLPAGALLVCSRATIGEIRIAAVEICTNQGLKSLVCRAGTYHEFLYYLTLTLKPQMLERAIGSTFLEIGKRDLASIPIRMPNEDEQRAIAAVLSDMDSAIETFERRTEKTRQIKHSMMQQLLTGMVRLGRLQVSAEGADGKSKRSNHSWTFNEAVVISTLAKHFGKEDYPLGRKRYTKLSYLLHRHAEKQVDGYLKKAAGPYNPRTRYAGPERIAIESGYIRERKSGPYSGFVAADNIAQAESYFEKWYGRNSIPWLNQFRFKKNDELEVLATVDMAVQELSAEGKDIDVIGVKGLIGSHSEWQAKLNRPVFSDANIAKAIQTSRELFESSREPAL